MNLETDKVGCFKKNEPPHKQTRLSPEGATALPCWFSVLFQQIKLPELCGNGISLRQVHLDFWQNGTCIILQR